MLSLPGDSFTKHVPDRCLRKLRRSRCTTYHVCTFVLKSFSLSRRHLFSSFSRARAFSRCRERGASALLFSLRRRRQQFLSFIPSSSASIMENFPLRKKKPNRRCGSRKIEFIEPKKMTTSGGGFLCESSSNTAIMCAHRVMRKVILN